MGFVLVGAVTRYGMIVWGEIGTAPEVAEVGPGGYAPQGRVGGSVAVFGYGDGDVGDAVWMYDVPADSPGEPVGDAVGAELVALVAF